MRLVSFLRALVEICSPAPFARRGSVAPARRALAAAMMAAGLIGGAPATAETPAPNTTEDGSELRGLVGALARAETPEAAAAIRRRLIRLRMRSDSATASLLVSRAAAARLAGDDGLALDLLDAAIVIAPEWAGVRHLRGAIHLARGAQAAAAADLAAAARLDPSDATTLALLARLREAAGDKAAALALLRRAAAADPQFPGLADAVEALSVEVEGQPL
ncbi:MAG: hypothetical protein LWW93_13915 [Hyphomicrobiales bacterium]|nr:hypothetical protein [Hyphomicrobiales bacterium]